MLDIREIPKNYSWQRNALLSLGTCFATAVSALFLVGKFGIKELLTVPATVAFFLVFEHAFHRFAMHRPIKVLKHFFNQHRWHHDAFTPETMAVPNLHALHFVMIPFINMVPVVLACAGTTFLVSRAFSIDVTLVFLATLMSQVMLYELMHLISHAPASWHIERIPVLRAVAEHHALHHHLEWRSKANFGLAFGGLSDRIAGSKITNDDIADAPLAQRHLG